MSERHEMALVGSYAYAPATGPGVRYPEYRPAGSAKVEIYLDYLHSDEGKAVVDQYRRPRMAVGLSERVAAQIRERMHPHVRYRPDHVTHCPKGHKRTDQNLYFRSSRPSPKCKDCDRERSNSRYQRQVEAQEQITRLRATLPDPDEDGRLNFQILEAEEREWAKRTNHHAWPDDDSEHVVAVSYRRGPKTGEKGLYRLTLTFTPQETA